MSGRVQLDKTWTPAVSEDYGSIKLRVVVLKPDSNTPEP